MTVFLIEYFKVFNQKDFKRNLPDFIKEMNRSEEAFN